MTMPTPPAPPVSAPSASTGSSTSLAVQQAQSQATKDSINENRARNASCFISYTTRGSGTIQLQTPVDFDIVFLSMPVVTSGVELESVDVNVQKAAAAVALPTTDNSSSGGEFANAGNNGLGPFTNNAYDSSTGDSTSSVALPAGYHYTSAGIIVPLPGQQVVAATPPISPPPVLVTPPAGHDVPIPTVTNGVFSWVTNDKGYYTGAYLFFKVDTDSTIHHTFTFSGPAYKQLPFYPTAASQSSGPRTPATQAPLPSESQGTAVDSTGSPS